MPTTYLETILHCFTAMSIDGLRAYLKDEYTYQEATKEVFLDKLEAIFDKHRAAGDTEFLLYPGACAGETCPNCGKRGYRFLGNHTHDHLDMIFETHGDTITDIYSCSQFRSDTELPYLFSHSYVSIDLDEKASFPKTPSYWSRVYAAQDAYNEMITQPPRKLRFDEIEFWLGKHSALYMRLGGFDVLKPQMKWRHFLYLYHDLKEIAEVISPKLDKIRQANCEYKENWTELELIDWVVSYEELYLEGPLEFRHLLTKIGEDYGFVVYNKEYLLTGEVFDEVYTFFNTMGMQHDELLHKYSINSGDDREEIDEKDNWEEKINDHELLRFHLEKRKELEKQGVFLPYNLRSEDKSDEEIPF